MLEHEPPTAMLQLAECTPDQPLEESCLLDSELGGEGCHYSHLGVPREGELALLSCPLKGVEYEGRSCVLPMCDMFPRSLLPD